MGSRDDHHEEAEEEEEGLPGIVVFLNLIRAAKENSPRKGDPHAPGKNV